MKARIIKYAVVFVFILLVFVLIKVSLTRLEDEIDENQVSTKGEISAGLDKEIKKEQLKRQPKRQLKSRK